MTSPYVLYAPNVNTGGGLTLLKDLLSSLPKGKTLIVVLDIRIKSLFEINEDIEVFWIKPSVLSRLYSEFLLMKIMSGGGEALCFHGLPPVLAVKGNITVFLQNRNYLNLNSLFDFSLKVGLRLFFERSICKLYKYRVNKYIVQTPSMKKALSDWYGDSSDKVNIDVFPFCKRVKHITPREKTADFIYVADGVSHKNHDNLLEAWVLLSKKNIFPTLLLTLNDRDNLLRSKIKAIVDEHKLKVFDLGTLSEDNIVDAYLSSKALIFPSKSESFGLPLIEAKDLGLDIIASELDFVRDVCIPKETFDPESPTSISRAVIRYFKHDEQTLKINSALDFWEKYYMNTHNTNN